ncbi:hypothetical protein [Sediminitomix flava]|uniref:WG repeat protein n=1 Tax=Sediminitomix flava TaxID=379075 RepID=A0A315ZCG0_SEDFL|nr:hypothetical protein [Sediminitomix flava]PWJ42783.1 hypothetical protein BC781_102329 [Sediminitomix flava]
MNTLLRQARYFLLGFFCLLNLTLYAEYRGESFIYGQIRTSDGEKIEGFIELLGADQWDDMLVADKDAPNFFVDRLGIASKLSYYREQNKATTLGVSREWNTETEPQKFEFLSSLWSAMISSDSPEASIPFIIQWGHIKRIEVHEDLCSIFLKNGNNHFVKLDASQQLILSTKWGDQVMSFQNVESIDFERPPKKIYPSDKLNYHGTVFTKHGVFEGNLEFLTSSENLYWLDEDVQAIEVDHTGMVLIDGSQNKRSRKTIDLNSVSLEVKNYNWGILEIPFSEIKSIQMENGLDDLGGHFERYKSERGIFATVLTKNGTKFSGYTVYDLNKTESIEVLRGVDEKMLYQIPIQKISKIEPNNFKFTVVELKSGRKLMLGQSPDVSISNQGLLLYKDRKLEKGQQYIQWSDIDVIYFE